MSASSSSAAAAAAAAESAGREGSSSRDGGASSASSASAAQAAGAATAASAAAGGVVDKLPASLEEGILSQPQRVTKRRNAELGKAEDSDDPDYDARHDIRSRDQKRHRVQVPRCSSPSHFFVSEEEEAKYGPEYHDRIPDRPAVDSVLRAVANLYYRPREVGRDGATVWSTDQHDAVEYPTLDLLMSPLRRQSPLDNWTLREIALFEAGICAVGKNFQKIQKMIGSKTTKDIVEFYYHWKKSSHYQLWRYHRTELTESNLTVAMQTALLKKNRAALAKAKLDTE